MSLKNTNEDGDQNSLLQPEDSEIRSLLKEFPVKTNVLIVEDDLVTLLKMKTLMKKFGYQVDVHLNAREAIAILTTCQHQINIVIWDFNMPGINGIEALKIIGSKLNHIPVIIMSDDQSKESVMNATLHGACDYVMKPIDEEVAANIWKHIVRKRMMSKPGLIPPVQLGVVQDDGLNQETEDPLTVDQGNNEQNIDKTGTGETQPIEPALVQSNGSDQETDGSRTLGQQNIGKEKEKKPKKQRVIWTGELQKAFLEAIDVLGGAKKANPMPLLRCMEEMNVVGLTRDNVASHLQKHRISLEQIPEQMQENNSSSGFRPSPLLGMNNGHTASSSLMNGRDMYPVQGNQYQNGFSALPNNGHTATSSLMNGRDVYPVGENQYQNGFSALPNNGLNTTSALMNGRDAYPVGENQYQNGFSALPNNGLNATSSLVNGRDVNPVQENQYQNGYSALPNNGLNATSSLMNGRDAYPVGENQYQDGFSALLNNGLTGISSLMMNGGDVYPVQENQHHGNNNQVMTNTMPNLPYFDYDQHQLQQQQYQTPQQVTDDMMRTNEPGQASGIDATDPNPFRPGFPFDPDEFFL